jgi:hypothetical protein
MWGSRAPTAIAALVICVGALAGLAAHASPTCPEQQATPQVPKDLALCREFEPIVRDPSSYPLNEYEEALGKYLGALCHRDEADGWKVDKRVRDTGPWIGTYADGKWSGHYYGTHMPVLIWYSPDFYKWLKANRPLDRPAPASPQPIPDGAIMVKEMYTAPAAACADVDPHYLLPTVHSSAVMVRDSKGALGGGLAAGRRQSLSRHGLRAILRELPRLGQGQSNFRGAQQHQGRTRRTSYLPQPRLLPQSAVGRRTSAHRSVRHAQ